MSRDRSKAVPLLQFIFICTSVVLYVAFVLSLFLIFRSFAASGWLCFVIVVFPRYLH